MLDTLCLLLAAVVGLVAIAFVSYEIAATLDQRTELAWEFHEPKQPTINGLPPTSPQISKGFIRARLAEGDWRLLSLLLCVPVALAGLGCWLVWRGSRHRPESPTPGQGSSSG